MSLLKSEQVLLDLQNRIEEASILVRFNFSTQHRVKPDHSASISIGTTKYKGEEYAIIVECLIQKDELYYYLLNSEEEPLINKGSEEDIFDFFTK